MPQPDGADELKLVLASTATLIQHLEAALSSSPASHASSSPAAAASAPNALAVLGQAATLLRAQTTKLSLLAVTAPFTPSAIARVIKALAAEILPTLATAVQLAAPARYSRCLRDAMAGLVRAVLREFRTLLGEIAGAGGGEAVGGRGALASTGVVWLACDEMVALGAQGLVGAAVARAARYHGTLKDAITELEGWLKPGDRTDGGVKDGDGEGWTVVQGDDGDEDDGLDSDSDEEESCSEAFRPFAERSLKVLKCVGLLFPPIIKRRLKTTRQIDAHTPAEAICAQDSAAAGAEVDGLLADMCYFYEQADEVVLAHYGEDESAVQAAIVPLIQRAWEVAGKLGELEGRETSGELRKWVIGWRGIFDRVCVGFGMHEEDGKTDGGEVQVAPNDGDVRVSRDEDTTKAIEQPMDKLQLA